MRDESFEGTITVIGQEHHTPYDRPPLSKQFLAGKWDEARFELVRPEALEAMDLDLRLGTKAIGLDPRAKSVVLENGSEVPFDKAIVATGSHPRQLRGVEPGGPIVTLRDLDDSRRLVSMLREGVSLVVVGGGFIGSEVAATARELGSHVTIIEALPVPLGRVLGARVGAACAALHEAHGVTVEVGTGVSGVERGSSGVTVCLDDGSSIGADVVVVGIGTVPTTGWLEGSGLELDDGLVVDETLHATDDILAAGDVVRWPDPKRGVTVRAEHWTSAAEQGALAGKNLLAGRSGASAYESIPYVWSDQYDVKIQVLGHPDPDDEVTVVEGSEHDGRFVAAYGRHGKLTAAVGFGRPRPLMTLRQLIVDGASYEEALHAFDE